VDTDYPSSVGRVYIPDPKANAAQFSYKPEWRGRHTFPAVGERVTYHITRVPVIEQVIAIRAVDGLYLVNRHGNRTVSGIRLPVNMLNKPLTE